jgi:hypothetical protein
MLSRRQELENISVWMRPQLWKELGEVINKEENII